MVHRPAAEDLYMKTEFSIEIQADHSGVFNG